VKYQYQHEQQKMKNWYSWGKKNRESWPRERDCNDWKSSMTKLQRRSDATANCRERATSEAELTTKRRKS
jgi:hypothetical protein